MMKRYDVAVIGGGMAGASIGFELSRHGSVAVLDMEPVLAYHTTGRSAATFLETYGGPQIRALTTGSRAFLEMPPPFVDSKLLTPRPLIQFARAGRGELVEELYADVRRLVPEVELLSAEQVTKAFPLVRSGYVECGIREPGAMEIDVAALHQGYLRGLSANGGEVVKSAEVDHLTRTGENWTLGSVDGRHWCATEVVNAAGAWGDRIARLAGAKPVGLSPLRRTIFMIKAPQGVETSDLPLFSDVDQGFYVKPEGAQFLCSPADETPCAPMDAKPDEVQIARAIDEINMATMLAARSVTASWAGLRTFAPDHNFVIGPDSRVPGFHWFVGQGGYGIQAAPAAAVVGAALVRGEAVPSRLLDRGLDVAQLTPHRLQQVRHPLQKEEHTHHPSTESELS